MLIFENYSNLFTIQDLATIMTEDAFLIIEDQKSMALLLQRELAFLTDLPIYICHSLAEATALLNTNVNFSVCLSDLNLPDAAQGEAIDLLLSKHITTIVVTASYNDETRQALFKRKVADYVLKDGLSSIRYAVQTAYTIHQNSQRQVWLLSSGSKSSSKLLGMLRIHHFQVSLYESSHELLKALKKNSPDLILLDVSEDFSNREFFTFVNQIRSQYSQNQLPMMSCAPSENIPGAIKLMKYGVNDFYNTSFTAEEFHIRVNQNIQQAESFLEIERISQTDALTGIFNRGHFFNAGTVRFEQLKSSQKYFFTVMADIDHFKLVNDNHGHQKGDDAIVYTAQQIQQTFADHLVARFGGEEFCILGEVEDASEIEALCETLRATIEKGSLTTTGVPFTISLGLTYSGKDLEEAVSKADKALYRAKESGRNQVSTEF